MNNTVLVVGASGLVGTAACLEFKKFGWNVLAASRRSPELLEGADIRHVALDLHDAEMCKKVIQENCSKVTHLVYTAVFEMPGLIAGWTDSKQIDANDVMFRNVIDPLTEFSRLKHVTLLQGTKAYGLTVGPIRIPARESQPRVEHPNFYWRQEDYLKDIAKAKDFRYTIFRPQLIVGPNHGVVMNIPPVIGVYAAIRKELQQAFSFPGLSDWVWEAVDVRLVAEAILWGAENKIADGETFNLTNGEVFSFKDMWKGMAEVLNIDVGEDESLALSEFIPANQSVWERIVSKFGLRNIPLEKLLGESHYYADMCFANGNDKAPSPTFVSTIKVKEAGFNKVWNTEESFCYWLKDLQNRKIIPNY